MSRVGSLALVALVACAAGCPDRGRSTTTPAAPPPTDAARAATPTGAPMPEVTMTSAGQRPGRPPITRLVVNVAAANPGREPRWFLVPSAVPVDADGGVDKLEQLAAPGGVTLGRFLGRGGFYAFALAPGARLEIDHLEVAWWNDDGAAAPPELAVRTGTAVQVGGADIATWFDADPAVSGAVRTDADGAQHVRSRRADGDREVAVEVTDEQVVRVTVR